MEGYLGKFPVTLSKASDYADFDEADWALEFLYRYGQIEGEHHKEWVLDQITRILLGTPVGLFEKRWQTPAGLSTEVVFETDEVPSEEYQDWIKTYHECGMYCWKTGIAP